MLPRRVNLWILVFVTFFISDHLNLPLSQAEGSVPSEQKSTSATEQQVTKQVAGKSQPDQTKDSGTPEKKSTSATKQPKIKKVSGKLALDHSVTVEIDNLSEYIESQDRDPSKFVLYLDGRPLKGMTSTWTPPGKNFLQFDIDSTSDSKEAWDALLSRPFSKDRGFSYPVRVSVGYGDGNSFPYHIKHDLVVINKTRFWAFSAFFVFVVFLFFKYATTSAMLRDPLSAELSEKNLGSYSLGRTQMAWWFFIVLFSYVYLWIVTNGHDILSESALGLLGISAATGLGAAVVGSAKKNDTKSKSEELNQEKAGLTDALSESKLQSEGNPSVSDVTNTEKEKAKKKMRIEQIEMELRSLKSISEFRKTPDFLNDILKDKDGITLHRFQIVVWTIVLGVIFLREVIISVAMPEFSGTLLALMGISGGTYIGFKFPEKQVK